MKTMTSRLALIGHLAVAGTSRILKRLNELKRRSRRCVLKNRVPWSVIGIATIVFVVAGVAVSANEKQRTPQSPVDVYGDPLPKSAVARLGTLRLRHGDKVTRVAFSIDGKQVASWSAGGTLSLWSVKSGKLLRRDEFPRTKLKCLSFLPAGRSLAVLAGSDGSIHPWDFVDGRRAPPNIGIGPTLGFLEVGDDGERLDRFAVSADGRLLAAGTAGHTDEKRVIVVGRLASSRPFDELNNTLQLARSFGAMEWLGFSPDGECLVALCRETGQLGQKIAEWKDPNGTRQVIVCKVEDGKEIKRFAVPKVSTNGNNAAVAISSDSNFIAVGTKKNTIHVFDLKSGDEIIRLEGHDREVQSLAFSSDGEQLVSGSRDKSVRLWDLPTERQLRVFHGHKSAVESVAFSPDGQTIVSGGQDNFIRLWNVKSDRRLHSFAAHEYRIRSLALSRDGRIVATGAADSTLRIWDSSSGKQTRVLQPSEDDWVNSVSISPDGASVAACYGNHIAIWDINSGDKTWEFTDKNDKSQLLSARYARDKNVLAAADSEGLMHVWSIDDDLLDRELRVPARKGARITSCCLSPDAGRIAVSTQTRTAATSRIHIWDTATGNLVHDVQVEKGNVRFLRFSRDGEQLASVGFCWARGFPQPDPDELRFAAQLWDVEQGKRIRTFLGSADPIWDDRRQVSAVDFSPDGKLLVTGEDDHTVVIYDLATGEERKRLRGHSGPICAVEISNDGRILATASQDMTGLTWDFRAVANDGD